MFIKIHNYIIERYKYKYKTKSVFIEVEHDLNKLARFLTVLEA
jgi:hypothetical protein